LGDDDVRDRGNGRRRQQGGNGMVRILVGVIVLLLVAAGGLGFLFFSGAISTAQPTAGTAATAPVPTPTPRPTTAASSGTAAAGSGAAASQEQGQPPQPIVTKQATYGDWNYTCVKTDASQATPSCSILQTLSNSTTKHLAFLWRIIASDKGLVAVWLTPTNVVVGQGMVIDVGQPKPLALPFNYCTQGECQVQADLAQDFVDTLTKATKANVTIFPIGSRPTTYPFSVKGLPDALAALKAPPT
jgi:invasion protein IalB